jgi:DGQHR domain-containing protein
LKYLYEVYKQKDTHKSLNLEKPSDNDHKDHHHQDFVRKVRNLFVRAGFKPTEVVIMGATAKGADIEINHLTEDKQSIRILVQCKESEEPRTFPNLPGLIEQYATKVRQQKASMALLVLGGYSIPAEYKDKDMMDWTREKHKVVYWDDDAWRFYWATVRSMQDPYSRHAMLRDFGYKIVLQRHPYVVNAFEITQSPRDQRIWVFSIEPERLLRIAHVFRRGSTDPEAYQRMLTTKRLKDIGIFLSSPDSMLANNIIVAFESKPEYSNGKLRIPAVSGSAWVVDGQHRLYGFCKLRGKKEDRELILSRYRLIVSGVCLSREDQAKLFKDINEHQEKLDRNLLLDLYDHLDIVDEEGTLQRVRTAKRLRKTEMFRERIKILKTDKGSVTLANIVDYPPYTKMIRSLGNGTYQALTNFFRAFYDTFKTEWLDPDKEYVLSTNKGVRMMISLCSRAVDYLSRANRPRTPDQMRLIAEEFRESMGGQAEFLKRETYKGKALGAGAPDTASRDIWASRINDRLPGFLSKVELDEIGREEREILRRLEESMRHCIETRLGSIDPDWWTHRVPGDVADNAKRRREKNERPWPWYDVQEKALVSYVDFTDYQKIILRNDNWDECFRHVFADKRITEAKLAELEPIRNDIAHSRKLDSQQSEHLRLYASDLMICISRSEHAT